MEIREAMELRAALYATYFDLNRDAAQTCVRRYGSLNACLAVKSANDEDILSEGGFEITRVEIPQRFKIGIIIVEPPWTHDDPEQGVFLVYSSQDEALLDCIRVAYVRAKRFEFRPDRFEVAFRAARSHLSLAALWLELPLVLIAALFAQAVLRILHIIASRRVELRKDEPVLIDWEYFVPNSSFAIPSIPRHLAESLRIAHWRSVVEIGEMTRSSRLGRAVRMSKLEPAP